MTRSSSSQGADSGLKTLSDGARRSAKSSRWRRSHLLRRAIFEVLLAICVVTGALGLCGCPALLVPSLAYQGYKYEHQPKAAPSKQSNDSNSRKSRSATSGADSSIE